MARGKKAAGAANRRADAEIQNEIGSYQHAVSRLTTENKELKEKLARGRDSHLHDVKVLKAQLNEGLSPELLALRRQIDTANDRAAKAKAEYKYISERWDRLIRRMNRMLVEHFNVNPGTAFELIVHLVGDESHVDRVMRILDVPDNIYKRFKKQSGGDDGLIAISEARGHLEPATEKRQAMYAAAAAIRQSEEGDDEVTA